MTRQAYGILKWLNRLSVARTGFRRGGVLGAINRVMRSLARGYGHKRLAIIFRRIGL